MKINISKLLVTILIFCIQEYKINAACRTNTDTSASTNILAYNEGFNIGVANLGKELYTLPESQNPCAKYAKECTKFSACKKGFKAGSTGKPSTPPTN